MTARDEHLVYRARATTILSGVALVLLMGTMLISPDYWQFMVPLAAGYTVSAVFFGFSLAAWIVNKRDS